MGYKVENNIDSRAMTDKGAALFVKGTNGKYHFALPVTGLPATGAAPEQVEKTVTTSTKKSYMQGRQDTPQKEFTAYACRDNFIRANELVGVEHDFLQINPDYTAFKFRGSVSYYQDEVSVGNNITFKITITVSSSEQYPVLDVYSLLEDTITFTSAIPDKIVLPTATGTYELNVATDPTSATITADSDVKGVATATVAANKVTITGVAGGSATIKLTANKEGYSNAFTTIYVIVPEA